MKLLALAAATAVAATSIAAVPAAAAPHGWHWKSVCRTVHRGHHVRRVCTRRHVRW